MATSKHKRPRARLTPAAERAAQSGGWASSLPLPAHLLFTKDLSGHGWLRVLTWTELRVLIVYLGFADVKGCCWPSRWSIAKALGGMDTSLISRAIKGLLSKRAMKITAKSRGGRHAETTHYRITIDHDADGTGDPGVTRSAGKDAMVTGDPGVKSTGDYSAVTGDPGVKSRVTRESPKDLHLKTPRRRPPPQDLRGSGGRGSSLGGSGARRGLRRRQQG